jgi:hypothetical protein
MPRWVKRAPFGAAQVGHQFGQFRVAPVAEFLCGLPHVVPHGFGDPGVIAQRAGDGGVGNAEVRRHVAQGAGSCLFQGHATGA